MNVHFLQGVRGSQVLIKHKNLDILMNNFKKKGKNPQKNTPTWGFLISPSYLENKILSSFNPYHTDFPYPIGI